jgi:RNase P subunit RPR2
LTEENWPINARKYPGKIWHICDYCFKEKLANIQYKFHTGLILKKRIKTGKCELCDKIVPKGQKLSWHHWDDTDTSKGIWACNPCHWITEAVEKHPDIIEKYLFWKKVTESPRYKNLTFESGPIEEAVV